MFGKILTESLSTPGPVSVSWNSLCCKKNQHVYIHGNLKGLVYSIQLNSKDNMNQYLLENLSLKFNIEIKHGFSCINIRQVPWEVLKTEAEGRGFQYLPSDLANVNAFKNHVRSLLLHKN